MIGKLRIMRRRFPVFGQIKRASSSKIGMLLTRPAQVNEFRATTSSQRGLPIDWHLTFTAACTSAPLHASCAGTLTAACVEALQQSSLVETALSRACRQLSLLGH